MSRQVARLALILVIGAVVYAVTMEQFSQSTANVIGLGYFILTVRLYDLIESIEARVLAEAN